MRRMVKERAKIGARALSNWLKKHRTSFGEIIAW